MNKVNFVSKTLKFAIDYLGLEYYIDLELDVCNKLINYKVYYIYKECKVYSSQRTAKSVYKILMNSVVPKNF